MSRVLKPSAHWQINGHYANSVDATKPVSLNSGTEKYDFVNGKLCFNFDGSTDLSHAAADTDTIAYTLDGHRYACVAGTTYYKDAAPVAPYTFYADATSIGTGLTGKMRDVTHWPVELTADELAQDFAMSLTPSHLWEAPLPIPQSAPMYAPVGAWGFDDGLNFQDVSGNGYDLTKSNVSVNGSGRYVLGGTGYLYRSVSNFRAADMSGEIELLVYPTSTAAASFLFSSDDGAGTYFFFVELQADNTVRVRWRNGGTFYACTSVLTCPDNKWTRLRIRSTGSAYHVYFNDVEDTNLTGDNNGGWMGDVPSGRTNIAIGCRYATGTPNGLFTGIIGEITYRSSELTDAQGTKIYRAGVPADREGELIRTLDGKTDLSVYGRTITRSNCVSLPDRMTFSNGGLSWSAIAGIQSYGYTYIDPTTGIPSHYATDGVTTWTNGIATGAMPFAVGSTGFSGVTADIVDLWATSGSITAEQATQRYEETKVLL